ncbi:MAG: spore photoproduct lyase [Clostridium sp.]
MFKPKRVIFEEAALDYENGQELLKLFKDEDIEIKYSKNGRITGIPGKTPTEMFAEGKNTLVVGIRKKLDFQSCKPSAHYQLPLVSGCMGMCEYCYLNTQMGKKPYIKIHVNTDEILDKAGKYIEERKPAITIFEGAATSDPIPVEAYTGALKQAIEYFGQNENSLFRFVTKFTEVDSLLDAKHNGRTTIRFSLNINEVIKRYEHKAEDFQARISAAKKVSDAGYKVGFIIAPVFIEEEYKEKYYDMLKYIKSVMNNENIMFEVISHRFTQRAKNNILSIFPNTILPMDEDLRKFKYGQFGYGKYIYKDEEMKEYKEFFNKSISELWSNDNINYII